MNLYYFIFYILALGIVGRIVVSSLINLAKILGWKEFIVAFFAISFGAAMPELFIGITSSFKNVPILSLGNIIGQNLVLFTLAPAICSFILKDLILESRTVRAGSTFSVISAVLPIVLALDGNISRIDGFILITSFIFYIFWLFSKKERFTKIYDKSENEDGSFLIKENNLNIFFNLLFAIFGLLILAFLSQAITNFALDFSIKTSLSLSLVGILVIGLGTSLPETYFSIVLSQKKQSWMIIGGLMGSVAVSSTLVLGIVSIINPIEILDFSSLATARFFLIISALFFLLFVRSNRKITIKEGLFLLSLYILFLVFEIIKR
jgi:cation:H+ antiporter